MPIEPVTHLEKTIAGSVEPVTHLEKVISEYGGGGGGGSVTVDASLSASSENPVQNKAIFTAMENKADASALNGKVSVSQGVANAGKFLIVGSDGNVAPVEMAAWQGGSY